VFDILTAYANINHPDDLILKQMIAIDYYLHFKVKPKNLFLEEFSQTEKTNIINELKLNHHKYRFVILPIDFDFKQFSENLSIIKEKQPLIIQYNGTTKAEVIH